MKHVKAATCSFGTFEKKTFEKIYIYLGTFEKKLKKNQKSKIKIFSRYSFFFAYKKAFFGTFCVTDRLTDRQTEW